MPAKDGDFPRTPRHEHPWPAVELRHLVALRAIARHQSFRAAARALGFTQGALSQQIAILEQRVGKVLVERYPGARRVGLTPEGNLLLDHTHRILDEVAVARSAFASETDQVTIARVGAVNTLVQPVMGEALVNALAAAGSAALEVVAATAARELFDAVASGELDLAIVDQEPPDGRLSRIALFTDPYVALVKRDSDAARADVLSLAELARERLYALPRTSESSAQLEDVAAKLGTPLTVAVRAPDAELLCGLVDRAGGCALLPRSAARPPSTCTTVPIDHRLPVRTIHMVWRNGTTSSAIADALVAELKAHGLRT